MLMGELLHSRVVKIGLEAETKFEAIEELVDLLVEAHEIPLAARNHVVDVVIERERSMSTGMEYGVALPHGVSDQIDDLIGALGIAPEGIPFESLDAQPAKLIVLLVLPKRNFQGHVRTLAGIAHLMNAPGFREKLIRAADVQEVLDLIEDEEDREELDRFRERL
ncbi:MAG TPA: PTS sugar transporter subunit IIA [Candidatus Hydrogenedentes bacterium]|nr:PTS sugar transporter subunit IIA [Candidatus Hydrogenedentota bacterium]HPG66410.1 PTS sugar transporter subunit IIA [Candidatus Hydrogenedentota bacterium]